ncbi:MAG: prephenate dehydratase [Microbacteriaceae bacterium]
MASTSGDSASDTPEIVDSYSYLGPAGTFTYAALQQVEAAVGKEWKPVRNVNEALADVAENRSISAMIAIENSVDGGVAVAQDALANIPNLRIIGEYLVPVQFILVTRPGTRLEDVRVVAAHPVAYAQCRQWLSHNLPEHENIPATSNIAAARLVVDGQFADAAITSPGALDHYPLNLIAEDIGDNSAAVTRFVLVSKPGRLPEPTGADKTSLIVELAAERSGALLELLEQFSTRGVNLSLIQSRPIGDAIGRYRFVIDADGHITDERLADAVLGIKRVSPKVIFLGSYPRADKQQISVDNRYDNGVFVEARDWLRGIISAEPQQD